MKRITLIGATAAVLALGVFTAINTGAFSSTKAPIAAAQAKPVQPLHVHKTASCGCCGDWIKHLEQSGFAVKYTNHDDLSNLKAQYGIGNQYQSCHTGVSADGFVFEGHVPAKFIRQFLNEEHPDSLGLSVPGMPVGSPGMEYENKFMPYQVLLLHKNGRVSVYAEVNTVHDQF